MTVNLLHVRSDANHFARVLERLNPDVVVVQELGPYCAEVLASVYPNHRLRPSLDFVGRGIATRLDATFGDIDLPGRPGTSAVLDVKGTAVRVAGMHLLNPLHFPWWVTARDRGRQLDGLFRWLDIGDDGPVVIAGDFNASPRWPAYKMVVSRLTDLVSERAEREGVDPDRTWGWRPGWPRLLRIDHVFGDGVEATEVIVEPVRGTDHRALVVDIELAD